jgi:hypothetical protein
MQHSTHDHRGPAATHRTRMIEYAIAALAAVVLLVARHNNPYLAGALFAVVLTPVATVTALSLLSRPGRAPQRLGGHHQTRGDARAASGLQAAGDADQGRGCRRVPGRTRRQQM